MYQQRITSGRSQPSAHLLNVSKSGTGHNLSIKRHCYDIGQAPARSKHDFAQDRNAAFYSVKCHMCKHHPPQLMNQDATCSQPSGQSREPLTTRAPVSECFPASLSEESFLRMQSDQPALPTPCVRRCTVARMGAIVKMGSTVRMGAGSGKCSHDVHGCHGPELQGRPGAQWDLGKGC